MRLKIPIETLRDVVESNQARYWAFVQDGTFFEHNDSLDPAVWKKLGKLTDAKLRKGFAIMLEKAPRQAADILRGVGEVCGAWYADAETGDVLLQCALLGEVVYG